MTRISSIRKILRRKRLGADAMPYGRRSKGLLKRPFNCWSWWMVLTSLILRPATIFGTPGLNPPSWTPYLPQGCTIVCLYSPQILIVPSSLTRATIGWPVQGIQSALSTTSFFDKAIKFCFIGYSPGFREWRPLRGVDKDVRLHFFNFTQTLLEREVCVTKILFKSLEVFSSGGWMENITPIQRNVLKPVTTHQAWVLSPDYHFCYSPTTGITSPVQVCSRVFTVFSFNTLPNCGIFSHQQQLLRPQH